VNPDPNASDSVRLGEVSLRAVLEGLPDATVGAKRDGTIVFVNALAESEFGYRREGLIGRPIEVLWPSGCAAAESVGHPAPSSAAAPATRSARAARRAEDRPVVRQSARPRVPLLAALL